jgi:uncharacterized protein
MNKSRRMASLQAIALAEQGHEVLLVDLPGCGDSEGDFSQVNWDDWVLSLLAAREWLDARPGKLPAWIWGLRTGCLLASAVATRSQAECRLLFWQPTLLGKQAVRQFMRLRTAAAITGAKPSDASSMAEAEDPAGIVEVAGYPLPPALVSQLELASMAPPSRPSTLVWIDVSNAPNAGVPQSSLDHAEKWRSAGWSVQQSLVRGPAFWQTSEIEVAPELLASTSLAFDSLGGR